MWYSAVLIHIYPVIMAMHNSDFKVLIFTLYTLIVYSLIGGPVAFLYNSFDSLNFSKDEVSAATNTISDISAILFM